MTVPQKMNFLLATFSDTELKLLNNVLRLWDTVIGCSNPIL